MGRWSDPATGLTQDRFRVWSVGDDLYSRAELEENWDTLDAILGRPVDGVTVWPPLAERGVGKGIWLYLQKLISGEPKLGDVKWVWAPTQTALTAVITKQQTAGYEVANGQSILAADHDFETLDGSLTGAIRLPDMVDHYAIGVAHDSTVGAADGITTNTGGTNDNTQGAHTDTINVEIDGHQHSVPQHRHGLAPHHHGMQHRHYMFHEDILPGGGVDDPTIGRTQTGSSRFGVVYSLKASAIADIASYPADTDGYLTESAPGGFTYKVPNAEHRHDLAEGVTGLPVRGPTGGVRLVMNTETNTSPLFTVNSTAFDVDADGAISESYTVDTKPLSVGLVPFIKVRNATGI